MAKRTIKQRMKFIDLFSGLGAFNLALSNQGHECVFAAEINSLLSETYEKNFNIKPYGNIKEIDKEKDIPAHDILCAGFPCQPFSKAGKQEGMLDVERGSLFDDIVDILKIHKPKYFILENVRNLYTHDKNKTWLYIETQLTKAGYEIDKKILSPHFYGIPQHRERLFIVGSKEGLRHFKWSQKNGSSKTIKDILKTKSNNYIDLEPEKQKVLKLWQKIIEAIGNDTKIVRPLWSMEWGATYPFEEKTPYKTTKSDLASYKGAYGKAIKGDTKKEMLNRLPNYAKTSQNSFPSWKKNFIRRNRTFYEQNKKILEPFIFELKSLNSESWQKLEWNVSGEGDTRNIYDYILQFRGSGVRVKRTDYFPSLVTVPTQIPIIGWEQRYISPEEGLELQSMKLKFLPNNRNNQFRAIGNAVNVKIIDTIAKNLILSS